MEGREGGGVGGLAPPVLEQAQFLPPEVSRGPETCLLWSLLKNSGRKLPGMECEELEIIIKSIGLFPQ